jgi:hypothetical protein
MSALQQPMSVLSFVQVAAESDEIQSCYSLLFLIVIATQIISLNPLWLKFGDLWFFISFVMTKYLRSLVMAGPGGRVGGGFIISTLRPCITFMWKKKEENTIICSSFKPALAQAPCLQAEHSTKSSCLFFIFPWEELLLNTFLQATSHCFQIGWKCFCS